MVTADGRIVVPAGDGQGTPVPIAIVNGQTHQGTPLQAAMDLSLDSSEDDEDLNLAE